MPRGGSSLTGSNNTAGGGEIVSASVLISSASTTGGNYYRSSCLGDALSNDWSFSTTGSATTLIWSSWNELYTGTGAPCATANIASVANRIERVAASARRVAELRPAAPARGDSVYQEVETARLRAEGLLREHLTERQQQDLSSRGYFDVVNFKSKRHYRIRRGRAGNVNLLDGPCGREVKKLCCHPNERVPDADTMLAQKLLIEFNEELFLKTANITDLFTGTVQTGQGLQATG